MRVERKQEGGMRVRSATSPSGDPGTLNRYRPVAHCALRAPPYPHTLLPPHFSPLHPPSPHPCSQEDASKVRGQVSELEAQLRERDAKLREAEGKAATQEAHTKIVVAETQVCSKGGLMVGVWGGEGNSRS